MKKVMENSFEKKEEGIKLNKQLKKCYEKIERAYHNGVIFFLYIMKFY